MAEKRSNGFFENSFTFFGKHWNRAHAIATSVPTWKKRKNQVFFGEVLKILFSFFVCKWVFGEYAESTI